MKNGKGQLFEAYLDSGARIICAQDLIPMPGQYLLAHAAGSVSPLAEPVFFSDWAPDGFRSAPLPESHWNPGTVLNLRGPLGNGFSIARSARKVALIVLDDSAARLRGLISIALEQDAEVVLVCNSVQDGMPEAVEVQPLQSMFEVFRWADYAAFDVIRDALTELRENFGGAEQFKGPREVQVLVRTSMPCGGLAECGVCALPARHKWRMTCKDGPVFELRDLL